MARSGEQIGHPLARSTGSVHTPTMTLKSAAFLAMIGSAPVTALLTWNFVVNLLNVMQGVAPVVVLLSSFIYALGALSIVVFFFAFHRAQS